MAATDDAFGYILGRGRLRAKAFRDVMGELGDGNYKDVTPEAIAKAENKLVDFGIKTVGADVTKVINLMNNSKREITISFDLEVSKGIT